MRRRNNHNQFISAKQDAQGLLLLLGTVALAGTLSLFSPAPELLSPCEHCSIQVQASEVVEPQEHDFTTKRGIERYIQEVFGEEYNNAMLILSCENKGLNQEAINYNRNGTTDHGIFQINSVHTKRFGNGFKTSVKENIDVAFKLQQEQGWKIWSCSYKAGIKSFWQ